MAIAEFELTNDALTVSPTDDWSETTAYRCHVCLICEEDGTFSAIVLNLPGAGSCVTPRKKPCRTFVRLFRA